MEPTVSVHLARCTRAPPGRSSSLSHPNGRLGSYLRGTDASAFVLPGPGLSLLDTLSTPPMSQTTHSAISPSHNWNTFSG